MAASRTCDKCGVTLDESAPRNLPVMRGGVADISGGSSSTGLYGRLKVHSVTGPRYPGFMFGPAWSDLCRECLVGVLKVILSSLLPPKGA